VVEAEVKNLGSRTSSSAPGFATAGNPFHNDNDVKTAAQRIAYIHDLLRNNANGPEMVQQMSAVGDEELYEGRHSSSRESSSYTMRADGTMVRKPFFGSQPD
jgi:hypothetical protein